MTVIINTCMMPFNRTSSKGLEWGNLYANLKKFVLLKCGKIRICCWNVLFREKLQVGSDKTCQSNLVLGAEAPDHKRKFVVYFEKIYNEAKAKKKLVGPFKSQS